MPQPLIDTHLPCYHCVYCPACMSVMRDSLENDKFASCTRKSTWLCHRFFTKEKKLTLVSFSLIISTPPNYLNFKFYMCKRKSIYTLHLILSSIQLQWNPDEGWKEKTCLKCDYMYKHNWLLQWQKWQQFYTDWLYTQYTE